MKILHVIYSLDIGGVEALLVDIINNQIKNNDVSLIIVNNIYDESLLETISKDVNVVKLNRKEGSLNVLKIIYMNILIYHIHPDVIHCHNCSLWKIIFAAKSKKFLTVHAKDVSFSDTKMYKKIFAISETVKKEILNNTKEVCVELVENGINTDLIVKKNKFSDSIINIVQVSRLDHVVKGQDIILETLSILLNKFKMKVTLSFIGTGPSLEYLKEIVSERKMQDNVIFLGVKNRKWIYNHLCDFDLLVQPSRIEGFGLTVVEAMAAKVPVLVSNVDGPYEIIDYGNVGYFFKSESAQDCASAIYHIANNYQDAILKTNAASERALELYSIERTSRKYLDYYKS